MSDILKRESNFGYKNVFMDPYSKTFMGKVYCVLISKSQHIPIHRLFPRLELKNDPFRFSCCHFILCVTMKINITLATTFRRFYNPQIIQVLVFLWQCERSLPLTLPNKYQNLNNL